MFCVLGTCVRAWKIREPEIAATTKRIDNTVIADIAVNGERNVNTTSSAGLSFIRQPPFPALTALSMRFVVAALLGYVTEA